MGFNEEINNLETLKIDEDIAIFKGNLPVLFSAPHTMMQQRNDGSIKPGEIYTKAIALYMNKKLGANAIVKVNDTGVDANTSEYEDYKTNLVRFIKENNVKLVIDLHGSKKERDFDIEFGTLNNLSADYSVIKELEKSFINNGLTNIKHNDPFKGGAITKTVYALGNVDVIQIEINNGLRVIDDFNGLEKICNAFIDFINKYIKYLNK